jgi:hypothetical protein
LKFGENLLWKKSLGTWFGRLQSQVLVSIKWNGAGFRTRIEVFVF